MGAVLEASTKGIKAYHRILKEVANRGIKVQNNRIPGPEIQKIANEASKINAMVDSLNRKGGRINMVDAQPSGTKAVKAVEKLGTELAQT